MGSHDIWDLIKRLNTIAIALTSESSWDLLLERILTEARSFTNCDAGTFYLLEDGALSFRVVQCDTLAKRPPAAWPPFPDMSLPIDANSIAGYVALTGEVLNHPDVYNLPRDLPYRFNHSLVDEPFGYTSTSILTLPLLSPKQEMLGVIQLINALDDEGNVVSFSPQLVELCSLLASQAAVALNNSRLYGKLQDAHDFYQELVGEAGDAIVALDREGTILTWNTGAERMFGWTAQEVLGRHFLELQKADDLEQITEHMRRASEGEMLSNVEVRHSRKDGTTFDAILTVSQVRDQKGEVIAIHGIYKDITERRKAEQELRRAHEETKQAYRALERTQASAVAAEKLAAVGLLTAGVSHEILNPLNIIILRLHTLIGNPDTPPEVTRRLRIMEKHANRITKITRDLLSFSRQREPELRLIDLNESIKRTLSLVEHGLRIQNIEVEPKLADELPSVLADQDQLQQVVLNLLTNAKDAMPDGGRLVLSTESVLENGEQFVEFRVEDTGPGITPEHLEKVFDPFFTTKSEGEGTGLGLSICQGIIETHGGTIWAKNGADGGASFVIRLAAEGLKI